MSAKICSKCKKEKPESDYYKWRRVCRKCLYAYSKKMRNRDINARREYDRNKNYKVRYGITFEDYKALQSRQGGKCKICRSTDSGVKGKSQLFIDHCHESGTVRGLICNSCNIVLGHLKNKIELLPKFEAYLKRFL